MSLSLKEDLALYDVKDLHPHQVACLSKLRKIPRGNRCAIVTLAKNNPKYFTELVVSLIKIGYSEYSFTLDGTCVKRNGGCDYQRREFIT